jgi:hypothetical protein
MEKKTKPKGQAQPREKKPKPETPLDRLKLEIAAELGLAEKVKDQGWGGLTAAESGRIGGLLTRRARAAGLMPERATAGAVTGG